MPFPSAVLPLAGVSCAPSMTVMKVLTPACVSAGAPMIANPATAAMNLPLAMRVLMFDLPSLRLLDLRSVVVLSPGLAGTIAVVLSGVVDDHWRTGQGVLCIFN